MCSNGHTRPNNPKILILIILLANYTLKSVPEESCSPALALCVCVSVCLVCMLSVCALSVLSACVCIYICSVYTKRACVFSVCMCVRVRVFACACF